MAAALALAFSGPANALVYFWNGGDYLAAGLPNPLGTLDVLNVSGGTGKSMTGFIENNGRINWATTNALELATNATTLRNNGLFDQQTDGRIYSFQAPLLDNAGILRKSGGSGDLLIDVALTNRTGATLDAGSGRIVYRNNASFAAGSIFTGSGTHAFNAAFDVFSFGGSFTGTNNLLFVDGTYNASALTKPQTDATFTGGTFTGLWNIDAGRKLTAAAGVSKSISDTFVNDGTLVWATTNALELRTNATTLRNNGLFDQQTDGRIYSFQAPLLDNAGILRKSGGSGDLRIDVAFRNTGAVESLSGNVILPANWTNNGTLRGTASYQTNRLTNAGDISPGTGTAPEIASLLLKGALSSTPAGSLSFDVGAGGVADLFSVTGAVAFDGVVRVVNLGGYVPQVGDTFRVMNYGSYSGSLLDVWEIGFGSDVTFGAVYAADHLDLTVTAVPEPASWLLMSTGLLMWLGRRHARREDRSL